MQRRVRDVVVKLFDQRCQHLKNARKLPSTFNISLFFPLQEHLFAFGTWTWIGVLNRIIRTNELVFEYWIGQFEWSDFVIECKIGVLEWTDLEFECFIGVFEHNDLEFECRIGEFELPPVLPGLAVWWCDSLHPILHVRRRFVRLPVRQPFSEIHVVTCLTKQTSKHSGRIRTDRRSSLYSSGGLWYRGWVGLPTPRRDMGQEIPEILYPSPWTDMHLWKHYLPATSLVVGKISVVVTVHGVPTCFLKRVSGLLSISAIFPRLFPQAQKHKFNVFFTSN